MISDDDLAALRREYAGTTDGWEARDRRGEVLIAAPKEGPVARFYVTGRDVRQRRYNRDFAVRVHRHFPALVARLLFAERCLADLHDETAAAEAVLRLGRDNARLRAALAAYVRLHRDHDLALGSAWAAALAAARAALDGKEAA